MLARKQRYTYDYDFSFETMTEKQFTEWERKENRRYLIGQKILGVLLLIIGIGGCIVLPEDCGGFIFAGLIGLLRVIAN